MTISAKPVTRYLIVVTILLLVLPVFFNIGSLLLTPSRVLFLVITPFLLLKLLLGTYGRMVAADWGVLAFTLWMVVSVFLNNPEVAVQYTGSNVIILLGGYLAARASIRNIEDFRFFSKLFIGLVLLSLPLALSEALTTRMIIPPLLEKIPGVTSAVDVMYPKRNGFDRAQVVFTHPIHYGLFCSLCFSMMYVGFAQSTKWMLRSVVAILIGFSCFLAGSSGPFLSLAVQAFLIFYAFVTQRLKNRWMFLICAVVILYALLEVASDRPAIYAIIERLTFSAYTANDRLVLFQYGYAQVLRTPILGVGFHEWELPHWLSGSIDNMWLLAALIFGVPAFSALLFSFLSGMIQVGRRDFNSRPDVKSAQISWVFTVISLSLTLATVAVWSEMYSFVFFILGSGIWLINTEVEENLETHSKNEKLFDRNFPVYTRFPTGLEEGAGLRSETVKP